MIAVNGLLAKKRVWIVSGSLSSLASLGCRPYSLPVSLFVYPE